MKRPKLTKEGDLATEVDMDDVGFCAVTPAMVREVSLGNFITSGPGIDQQWMPTSRELDTIIDMMQFAVNHGQMIDFGYWPNDMIRETGTRAGALYTQNALGHPFSTPYIIIHSWDDPKLEVWQIVKEKPRVATCAYLVNPFPQKNKDELCIDFEAMTFEGMQIPKHGGQKCLGIGDRVLLNAEESRRSGFYAVQCIPFAMRWGSLMDNPEFKKMASNRNQDDLMRAAAGNVCDPVLTALLLLNTRGIQQQTIAVSPKLNQARIKNNKPPIPPYRKVDSASYVTAVMNRVNRSRGPGTGTHASPVMHIRQSHWRQYKTGERTFIRDTLVAATDEQRKTFTSARSHYVVKKD